MVMIKSRYLLIEIDREPHANGVGPQDKDLGGKFYVNWQAKVFKHKDMKKYKFSVLLE